MIGFKGAHYPKSVIMHAVFFYVRYAVSYRDPEEILAERGISVDRTTLNRRVVKFAPQIAARAQNRKRPAAKSWRMDEIYIKVKGRWAYLYRAVDRDGQTLDFTLSELRDLAAARRFVRRAIETNGVPGRVVIDNSGANLAGLQAVNTALNFSGSGQLIEIRQVKYLNNILAQDHRFVKQISHPMTGFKAFQAAEATLAGIEAAHMIRKDQIPANGGTAFQIFCWACGIIMSSAQTLLTCSKFCDTTTHEAGDGKDHEGRSGSASSGRQVDHLRSRHGVRFLAASSSRAWNTNMVL